MDYGLAGAGQRTLVLDEGNVALGAWRGNFGLVWTQGKGLGLPAYALWSRRSAALWTGFAIEATLRGGVSHRVELLAMCPVLTVRYPPPVKLKAGRPSNPTLAVMPETGILSQRRPWRTNHD